MTLGSLFDGIAVARWLRKPYSDSAVYKAAGNSVATVCVEWILARVMCVLERMDEV